MMFDVLTELPPDPLLSVIGLFRADPRLGKIDLGVGVYRDETGATPVLAAVKEAEGRLLRTQTTKAYVGPAGDLAFVDAIQTLVFGPDATGRAMAGLQTTGGTAALRIGAELLARAGIRRIHVGTPSWANHRPILDAVGLEVIEHRHFDPATQTVSFDEVAAALEKAQAGDAVLLQASCHNPTGADFSLEQWAVVAESVSRRGLVPFIDIAYQGLGAGLEADVAGARLVIDAAPEAVVASSCSKSFGLYRERTGAVFAYGAGAQLGALQSNLLAVARASYSMPPDHGAAVVRTILEDEALKQDWLTELARMRERINGLRARLAAVGTVGDLDLSPLAGQFGMFSQLPLPSSRIVRLREDHAVYMTDSGRVNLAGLRVDQVEPLLAALVAVSS